MGSRDTARNLGVTLVTLLTFAATAQGQGVGQQGTDDDLSGDLIAGNDLTLPQGPQPAAEWTWRQILSSPRIGGQFTSISVDPKNPQRIFLGTQENTVLRSLDGGVTWRELEVSPFVNPAMNIRPAAPGLPRLGEQLNLGLSFFVDPAFQKKPADRILIFFSTLFGSLNPRFWSIGFQPYTPPPKQTLLWDSTRRQSTFSVRRIAICPGAEFPLVVATWTELLGSQDDGLSYVRLLRVPGRSIRHVECSRSNPNDMIAATSYGPFLSHDGGVTWDQDLTGWPGQLSAAVAFDRTVPRRVHIATNHLLYSGDPNSDEGLRLVYPDFNNTKTAPWKVINWIEPTKKGVFLGTDDGMRVSYDAGESWENVNPLLTSRLIVRQITMGSSEAGTPRLVAILRDCPLPERKRDGVLLRQSCRQSHLSASDDLGETWFPYFLGMTRRQIYQIAAAPPSSTTTAPRWWAVAGAELWATVPARLRDEGTVDRKSARWARAKLLRNPTLDEVVHAALNASGVSAEKIHALFTKLRNRNYFPRYHFTFRMAFDSYRNETERDLTEPFILNDSFQRTTVDVITWAKWRLQFLGFNRREASGTRKHLHELLRRLEFMMTDAWHERRLLLGAIGRGMTDRLQVQVWKARIDALEAFMEIWMRRELDSFEADPKGGQYEL